ncbi:Lpp/OprI family alanine-zipper lipoprotein [Ectothiorhodospira magna]|nr:Lpp/OprI family alanine-zipper lipoprotein [Ectothiorhodospira magna]
MFKIVMASAAALTLVLTTGCATTKSLEENRQMIDDVRVTSDQALRTANEARSSADQANRTANEANRKADRALQENARLREMIERMERTFQRPGK